MNTHNNPRSTDEKETVRHARVSRIVVSAVSTLAVWVPAVLAGAGGFPSENATLLSHVSLNDFATNPSSGNDCWGYVSASGREYALMGIETALAVIEVTDPTNPVIIEEIEHSSSLWGDVKVYLDYAYVSNESGGGIDIIDLSDVDNGNVVLVQRMTTGGVSASHNVALDPDSGFLYLCGGNINGGRLVAFDLSDPEDPTLAGQVSAGEGAAVHDAQIVTFKEGPYAGQQIAFCANGGTGLDIYDVTDKSDMFRLSRTTYPNLSYAHQCWLSGQYVYLNDELDGVNETVIFDVSDLESPSVAGTYSSGPATDHNGYVHNGFIYEADYRAGLRVFDATDPLNPEQVAWLDTYPESDSKGFDGAWSVYPFFPSGTVIVSDITRGMFLVEVGLPALSFEYPNGLPDVIDPSGHTFVVEIVEDEVDALDSDSPALHLDSGEGFVDLPMNHLAGNQYEATFPPTPCGSEIAFYVSAATTERETITDPFAAPGTTFSALSASDVVIAFEDHLEVPSGWIVGGAGDDATTGVWERVDPLGTAAQPEDDHTEKGALCFVTGQGEVGGGLGDNDVDDGQTTLITAPIDLTGLDDAVLSYWRWYSNTQGNDPNNDIFIVDVSDDDGATWTNVEVVGPTGPETSGGWFQHAFNVADFVEPTAQVRLRFIASDENDGSIVEAAVDDVQVTEILCDDGVLGDLDGDGIVGTGDLLLLLGMWGACEECGNCLGDLDGDCTIGASDLIILLGSWG